MIACRSASMCFGTHAFLLSVPSVWKACEPVACIRVLGCFESLVAGVWEPIMLRRNETSRSCHVLFVTGFASMFIFESRVALREHLCLRRFEWRLESHTIVEVALDSSRCRVLIRSQDVVFYFLYFLHCLCSMSSSTRLFARPFLKGSCASLC